ncbi:MAG TPA: folylpolyglutamate synthase/dihydrofolate synthase family protein [Verrucomicrobiales bacterium]|jgi:dihydrofolate synthase/folylpolyglutamate synthase|nr:folylpolyglutamate synthase/dihydrofolate synthase family protein [Verrucomicrobiales bacterium]
MTSSLAWLYSVQLFGIKPGLENTRRLLKELQLPGPHQKFLHVAGTNGKGSTCAFIESILRRAGERTALFTSPHLVSFCERMRCGAQMITMEEVEQGIEALRPVVAGWDPHPTFFELTLMLALDWFDRQGAEVVVLETGMGGRLDATNALTPLVSVLTPIDMDHQQWLGSTLAEIAAEKAGIIKPGVPAVSAPQAPEATRVLREAADRAGTTLTFIREPWPGDLPLSGEHQRWNAALAVAAVEAAGFRVPPSLVAEGLAATEWPARFHQLAGGRTIIDGAHNPHGAATAVRTWRQLFGEEKATVIFGAVASKDHAASLALLAEVADKFLFVTLQSPRAVPAAILAMAAPDGFVPLLFNSLPEALRTAAGFPERTLICGSLYLCGEALSLMGAGGYEPSAQ